MAGFDASEVFQFAIRIEENGEAFYLGAVQRLTDDVARQTFKYLAEQEVAHKKVFKGMLDKFGSYQPPETYADEYYAYLKAYVDGIIFSKDKLDAVLGSLGGTVEALEFGIQREIDSILYYLEMKRFVPESEQAQVDRIIEEERKHFLKLTGLKKNYQN